MLHPHRPSPRSLHPAWGVGIFLLIAVAGLFYVKWSPYYDRAWLAAQTHSIGSSILTGPEGALPAPSWHAALDYAMAYGLSIWKALLLGLLLGSAIQALLPARWVGRWLGGPGVRSVFAGSLLAVPSMMCTCCSAPVVNGLRQCRAAPGGAAAYWLGNTMLNPATLIFMGFVLGWHWVGLRLAFGLLMVWGIGWWLNHMNSTNANAQTGEQMASQRSIQVASAPLDEAPISAASMLRRWATHFASMAIRLLPEYLILVLLLGAARAWLFPALDASVDNSVLWIVGAVCAGLLFVIPTAGEVPIVQAMLAMGTAAGPAAALLMTLPPISLPSLAMVARSFRRSEIAALIIGVGVTGLLAACVAIGLGF